jgi:hypothetical protein
LDLHGFTALSGDHSRTHDTFSKNARKLLNLVEDR